jgi:hypothetical protein
MSSLPTLPRYYHLPKRTLIEISSCAIWDRNKVAVAAATGIWLMEVGFLIQGKSLPFIPVGDLNVILTWYGLDGNRRRACKY